MSGLGPMLVDLAEELYRQVNPNFVQGDMLTSQVFEATRKDQGQLSVNRATKTTAKAAFDKSSMQAELLPTAINTTHSGTFSTESEPRRIRSCTPESSSIQI